MNVIENKWVRIKRTGPLEKKKRERKHLHSQGYRCLLPASYLETNECCGIISFFYQIKDSPKDPWLISFNFKLLQTLFLTYKFLWEQSCARVKVRCNGIAANIHLLRDERKHLISCMVGRGFKTGKFQQYYSNVYSGSKNALCLCEPILYLGVLNLSSWDNHSPEGTPLIHSREP